MKQKGVERKTSGGRDGDRKIRILRAAEELFAQKGYEGTSIREIGKRARTNTALIYYYFGDKESLYRSTLEEMVIEIPQHLEELLSSPEGAEGKLRRIMQMMVTLVPRRSHFFQIIHRELANESPRLGYVADKYFARNYELVRSFMKEAIRGGHFRDLDLQLAPVSLVAMIIFFFYNRFLVERILGLDPLDETFSQRLVDHTLDLFLHGALVSSGLPGEQTGRPAQKNGRSQGPSPPRKGASKVHPQANTRKGEG